MTYTDQQVDAQNAKVLDLINNPQTGTIVYRRKNAELLQKMVAGRGDETAVRIAAVTNASRLLQRNREMQSRFLDTLISRLSLKNDAALGRALESNPPSISKMRSAVIPIGPILILRAHEISDIPLAELKAMLNEPALKKLV